MGRVNLMSTKLNRKSRKRGRRKFSKKNNGVGRKRRYTADIIEVHQKPIRKKRKPNMKTKN